MLARQGSDHQARLLLDAITRSQEFVALSFDDRRAILEALDRPPESLVDLRSTLFAEINWRRGFLDTTVPYGKSPYLRRSG